jgi:hypothetical protein
MIFLPMTDRSEIVLRRRMADAGYWLRLATA